MISKRALALASLVGMGTGVDHAHGDRAATASADTATPALTVMTYNVNWADRGRDDTMDAIDAGDADVVLLQEVNKPWAKLLRKRFRTEYPHMVFHPHTRQAGGLAVLSKHAITEDVILPPAEGWFPAERLTIDSPLGALDILHVHLRPAILDGSWITGYLKTPPIRLREIEAYWNQMPRPPAIVAGDFNEEPDKGVAGFLAGKGMTRVDSGGKPTTWSWSGTYAGQQIALALDIDHVVIGSTLKATRATVLDQGKSDHRPVVVTLTAAEK
jgi:endonuclease/exonuclease/phosphatase (EEP) superfamily protein YafD